MRTVHPSGCHTAVKPFFRANIMKIKLNLLQTEQGVCRLTSLASGASLAPSALTQSILVSLVAGQLVTPFMKIVQTNRNVVMVENYINEVEVIALTGLRL